MTALQEGIEPDLRAVDSQVQAATLECPLFSRVDGRLVAGEA